MSIIRIQNFKKELGQTILEIIVALALIILFLSGVILIELFAIRNIEYAQNKSLATQLARQQLDRARVVRDTSGFSSLYTNCNSACYINNQLTPVPMITPTGTFGQEFKLEEANSTVCPLLSAELTPVPTVFKASAIVSWAKGTAIITPAPQVAVSSCMTDWR